MIQGCGARAIKEAIQEELGIGNHNDELTADKMFSYEEVIFSTGYFRGCILDVDQLSLKI